MFVIFQDIDGNTVGSCNLTYLLCVKKYIRFMGNEDIDNQFPECHFFILTICNYFQGIPVQSDVVINLIIFQNSMLMFLQNSPLTCANRD